MGFLGTCVVLGPNPKKIELIKEWQNQVSTKRVKLFLGSTNFYKKFIKDFSTLAKPLTSHLKKEGSFKWEDEQQSVFDLLKGKLLSTLVNASLNSLKNSNVNLKMETMEKEGIEIHSLTYNTSGVKGAC
jgi:hypothetical protein